MSNENIKNNNTVIDIINQEPVIYTSKNISMLKDIPVLDDGEIYIYVMLNSQEKIKIGQTTNIQQRLQSLSGSNGGGERIIRLYCSPSTYIKSMESAIHNYFNKYRIEGTEWFKGEDLNFDDVVKHVNGLFYTNDYKICNELRKEITNKEIEREKIKKLQEQHETEKVEKSKDKKSKSSTKKK